MKIIGHSEKIKAFERLLKDQELPHALLFAGASGIGKRTFAFELSRQIYCDNKSTAFTGGCGKCASCQLFDSGNFPDFYLLEGAQRENSKVENIRELLNKLSLTAYSNKPRIVILNDAEFLSVQAANILLKSLEEPRPNTYYFLISANASRLPMTILSRCQLWNFSKLTTEELTRLATGLEAKELKKLSVEKISELAELSDGSIETLLSISQNDAELSAVDSLLKQLVRGETKEILKQIESLVKLKEDEQLAPFLNVLIFKTRLQLKNQKDTEVRRRLSVFLSNLLKSHYLIFDRHFNLKYLMSQIFIGLIPEQCFAAQHLDPEDDLLKRIIV